MAWKKISDRWRFQHCGALGVAADYCVLQFKYADRGWGSVATCHPAAIEVFKREGVKARADLLKLSPAAA